MVYILVFFLVLVKTSLSQATDPSQDGWKQISEFPVCVKPRDNGYGFLNYHNTSKLVGALRLKWVNGALRCLSNEVFNSRWGCAEQQYPLNIIVTDESNHVIFPLQRFINSMQDGLWYSMPLVDAVYSDDLVFTNFAEPFFLAQESTLRFWYGEDLMKASENDNQGQVCFDVFVRFV